MLQKLSAPSIIVNSSYDHKYRHLLHKEVGCMGKCHVDTLPPYKLHCNVAINIPNSPLEIRTPLLAGHLSNTISTIILIKGFSLAELVTGHFQLFHGNN